MNTQEEIITKYKVKSKKLNEYIASFVKMKKELEKKCLNELSEMAISNIGYNWRDSGTMNILRPYKATYYGITDPQHYFTFERLHFNVNEHSLSYRTNQDIFLRNIDQAPLTRNADTLARINDTFVYLHSLSREDNASVIKLKNKYCVISIAKACMSYVEITRDHKDNTIISLQIYSQRSSIRALEHYKKTVKRKCISLDEFDEDMQALSTEFKDIILHGTQHGNVKN